MTNPQTTNLSDAVCLEVERLLDAKIINQKSESVVANTWAGHLLSLRDAVKEWRKKL